MLTYLVAIAVGLGSFGLYMAAFFFPEVHRRYDLIWSGVGLFYALVLWVCAERITGALLLGQIASVALLGWFGWQTLTLRRSQTPITQQTQLPASATSPTEVFQLTLRQIRANFQQSADRSPLAAQLSQVFDRLESAWIGLKRRATAFTADPMVPPEPVSPPPQPTIPRPAPAPTADPTDNPCFDEPHAEWSELDTEFHPDLDTIGGYTELDNTEANGLNRLPNFSKE